MTPDQRVPAPLPADSADTLLRRLVARLDETGGLLLEFSAGSQSKQVIWCLDDNHRTLAEARAWLRPPRLQLSFAQFHVAATYATLGGAPGLPE
jgi:hypothetical protein